MAERGGAVRLQIIPRKGKERANADLLSRLPDPLAYSDCYRAEAEAASLSYCIRAHVQWGRFEEDVDDDVPLAAVGPETPLVNVCAEAGDSSWADVILPKQKREEQVLDPGSAQLDERREGTGARGTCCTITRCKRTLDEPSPAEAEGWCPVVRLKRPRGPRVVPNAKAYEEGSAAASVHPGRGKTMERLRRNFHWPSLSADFERYVKASAACNRSKRLSRRLKAPLRSFTAGFPMEKVHMDILGSLPESRNGNKYVRYVLIGTFGTKRTAWQI